MSRPATCKSDSTFSTNYESPFERLSAFATTLRSACEQLEIALHGTESEQRLKVSSDGYPSGPWPLGASDSGAIRET